MGIGVGWPLLCIELAYLCYLADINPAEVNIMGDDIAALTKTESLRKLISLLELYRLPVNRRKSYSECRAGVFCENLITVHDTCNGRVGVVTNILPLGQASLKRVREERGPKEDAPNLRSAAANLRKELRERGGTIPRVVRLLAKECSKKGLKVDVKGPAIVGGCGAGAASAEQLAMFIMHGACATTKGTRGRTGSRLNHFMAHYVHGHELESRDSRIDSVPVEE